MTTLSTQLLRIMDHDNNSSSVFISADDHASIAIRGLCFLLGISGNITVVVFLLRHFKRDNFTHQLILSLAVSDILCLLTLPVWICDLLLGWTMGLTFCKIVYFITYTGIRASVLSVTLMSVQRYLLVLYRPQWSKLGHIGEKALLTGVWVIAGLLSISTVITVRIFKDEGKFTCQQVVRSEGEKVGVLLLEFVLFYVIPLSTMTTSYVCLHKKVSARALTNNRLAALVTTIIVTFVLCNTPYVVVSIMMMVTPSQPLGSMRRLPYRGPRCAVQSIVFLNSCVNPLLYAFNFHSLRQSADKNVAQISRTVQQG